MSLTMLIYKFKIGPVAGEGIFEGEGGANQFARTRESAGLHLGAEGLLFFRLARYERYYFRGANEFSGRQTNL